VRLTAYHLDLDSTQQLLAFFESQPDLLRRQIGDRPGDCADVIVIGLLPSGVSSIRMVHFMVQVPPAT
jgi:hypothetical protein